MDPDDLVRLKRNIAAATDDALIALANRGLVRRAAKDLDQKDTFQVEETDNAILVRTPNWTVTIPPEGPTAASDDTSATGVTRQILTATMFLRDSWLDTSQGDQASATTSPDEPPRIAPEIDAAVQVLIGASMEDLIKWAGKTPLLEASAMLASSPKLQIHYTPQLMIEFAESGGRVMLMTDKPAKTLRRLLEQFKSTVPKPEHSKSVLLAVLVLKQSAGHEVSVDSVATGSISEAVREDRIRISKQTQALLSSFAASGIGHPSSRIIDRFQTASVAAEAARFPRLARLLSSIADDAQLQISRSAAADPERMAQRIVVAFALTEATAQPESKDRMDLFGRPRTQYNPVGDLDLSGLGAYGWRTASGFEGVTALFWEQNSQTLLTASSTRGEGQDMSFSLPGAYESGIGWSGSSTIECMCRSQIHLSQAKINSEGRLSLSENTRVTIGEPTDPNQLEFGLKEVNRWSELRLIAQRAQPLGLRSPDPCESYLIIKPAHWGERWFDELDQAFVWDLQDEDGDSIHMRVPWQEVDEQAIVFLEAVKLDREQPSGLLGRVEVSNESGLSFYPFSMFSVGTKKGDKILCPQFDQFRIQSRNLHLLEKLRKKFKRDKVVQTRMGEDSEALPRSTDAMNLPPLLQKLLVDVDRVLSAALEMGATRLQPAAQQVLTAACERFQSLGVRPMTEALQEITRESQFKSATMLRAAYRLTLFRQAARLIQQISDAANG